jgi:hypothetical protein
MITRSFPVDEIYRIRDPKNFYAAMRSDVELLHKHKAYVSLTTVIVCCLDALGADSGRATKGKFEAFVSQHFPLLIADIEKACPGRKGTAILYDSFRNGFAHLRAPKPTFVIAEDHEVNGEWVGLFQTDKSGSLMALNVDRLTREFPIVLDRLESNSAAQRQSAP